MHRACARLCSAAPSSLHPRVPLASVGSNWLKRLEHRGITRRGNVLTDSLQHVEGSVCTKLERDEPIDTGDNLVAEIEAAFEVVFVCEEERELNNGVDRALETWQGGKSPIGSWQDGSELCAWRQCICPRRVREQVLPNSPEAPYLALEP